MTHTITCEQCESEFKIVYDDQVIEETPDYCVFCGEYTTEHRDDPPSLRGFADDDDVEL